MVYSVFVLLSAIMLCFYHYGKCRNDRCIDAIFLMMWVIFAIEFYTTKDYGGYYEGFYDERGHWELIYTLLVQLFRPLGFITFNACVSAFEIFTLCVIFKKIVPRQYRWISLAILILNTDNLFIFMNLKRQFFAMMVSMWIIYFLIYSNVKGKYLWSILIYLCAINIHTSAYVTIGYFILPLIKSRLNITAIVAIAIVYIASYTFHLSSLTDKLFLLLNSTSDNADYYGQYILQQGDYEDQARGIGSFVVLYNFLMFLFLLLFNKRFTGQQYKIVLCSILSFILMNILKGNFFRLYLYYSIFNIFSITFILSELKKRINLHQLYIMMLCLALILPLKSYSNAFITNKVSYMTVKYKHFYTIFHKHPDKKDYLF